MSGQTWWQRAEPALDTSSVGIVGPLKRAQAAYDLLLLPLFESAPVTQPELDVLLKLGSLPPPVIAVTLARLMGRSGAAVSKILAKLEGRGMIAREPNPADRRAALVRLTPEGERVLDEVFPRQLDLEATAVARLSDRQRAAIARALGDLAAALDGARTAGSAGSG